MAVVEWLEIADSNKVRVDPVAEPRQMHLWWIVPAPSVTGPSLLQCDFAAEREYLFFGPARRMDVTGRRIAG